MSVQDPNDREELLQARAQIDETLPADLAEARQQVQILKRAVRMLLRVLARGHI